MRTVLHAAKRTLQGLSMGVGGAMCGIGGTLGENGSVALGLAVAVVGIVFFVAAIPWVLNQIHGS